MDLKIGSERSFDAGDGAWRKDIKHNERQHYKNHKGCMCIQFMSGFGCVFEGREKLSCANWIKCLGLTSEIIEKFIMLIENNHV